MTKRDRERIGVVLAKALAKNPGSPYVSLYLTRHQANVIATLLIEDDRRKRGTP